MTHAAYVFDAYGTLFDVHAAVRRHADRAGPDGQRFSDIWRAKQLEYSWVRSLMGSYRDFWALTEDALDYAFERVPGVTRDLRSDFLDAYRRLDCFPEVPDVLRQLKAKGALVSILSNGTTEMLESAVEASGLGRLIDDLFSVDDIGIYKTAPAAYEMVTGAYMLPRSAISFQSSNRWDVAGAARFGFRSIWINRQDAPDEYADHPPAFSFPSLEALVGAPPPT